MVPLPVIVPPVRPFPAVIDVTVPPEFAALIVTLPVEPEMEILLPAVSEVTPVFVKVMPPVEPDTLMPVPAAAEVTPVLETVTDPVEPDTLIPVPAAKAVTLAAGAELAQVVPLLVRILPLAPGATT
jgi:hypothetical protein